MKNRGVDQVTDLVIGGAGASALALAASAGWFARGQASGHMLDLQSGILVLVGLGLFVASFAIRRAEGRIAYLEDQISTLKRQDR